MKHYLLFILLSYVFTIQCSFQETLNKFLIQYQRPATVLYVSNNPKLLSVRHKDVLVIWSQNKHFEQLIKQQQPSNALLLAGKTTEQKLINLSECEHFDVAIIETNMNPGFFRSKAHLADYTFVLNNKIKLIKKNKKNLSKGWWKSRSWHKNYPIKSTFKEKYFIKPKEYMESQKNKNDKKYNWKPGINLLTFHHLQGKYPTKQYIREKILETFDPLTHQDIVAGNLIIQGKTLKAIDYDDTIYGNPYERLRITLEVQLGMKYK